MVAALSATSRARAVTTRGDGLGGDGLVISPQDYDSVVIWLHGLGDTAMGWAPAMPSLGLERSKFVIPTAVSRGITLNGGMEMPGWFDIFGLSPTSPEDERGFAESSARVCALVEREIAHGIPANRIIVAGFSQGGALALHVTLRYPQRLAGCVALSTWLPLRREYPAALSATAKLTPVLQCHGEQDGIVPRSWGRGSFEVMQGLGLEDVTWKEYKGMAHSACDQELQDVGAFLKRVLSESGTKLEK